MWSMSFWGTPTKLMKLTMFGGISNVEKIAGATFWPDSTVGPGVSIGIMPYKFLGSPKVGKAKLKKRHGRVRAVGAFEAPALAVGNIRRSAGNALALARFVAPVGASACLRRKTGGVAAKGTSEDTELIEILLLMHEVA